MCLPCQPSPACCASGFSITGAVSTNTLTSVAGRPPGDEPAELLEPALHHLVVVAAAGVDRDVAAPGGEGGQRVARPARRTGRATMTCGLRPERLRVAALRGAARQPAHARHGGRRPGSRAGRRGAPPVRVARAKPTASKPSVVARATIASRMLSAAATVARHALVGNPRLRRRRAGLPEHVDGDAAARDTSRRRCAASAAAGTR